MLRMIADLNPASRRAMRDTARHVEPGGDQAFARDHMVAIAKIDQVPRHMVDVIVADEQLDET